MLPSKGVLSFLYHEHLKPFSFVLYFAEKMTFKLICAVLLLSVVFLSSQAKHHKNEKKKGDKHNGNKKKATLKFFFFLGSFSSNLCQDFFHYDYDKIFYLKTHY